VPGVRPDIFECPAGRDECDCREFRGPAGDECFIDDARAEGWLCTEGAGLRAYYRFHGMIEPEYERRVIPSREVPFTIAFPGELDMDQAASRHARR
jgi:hypothetical protein